MTPPPWIRVVIVNFNGADYLQKAVDALAEQSDGAFECVVVDNASTDGSPDRLILPDARFTLLRSPTNLGFAGGSNLGAREARSPWLAMLNPDAFAHPDWLKTMHAACLAYPDSAWFGSTQLLDADPERLDGGGDNLSIFGIAWRGGYGQRAESVTSDITCFAPCAAAALYRREAFEALGGFAEDFFCYLEDVDLGFRLNLMGYSGLQLARARVRHAGSAITGRHSPFTIHHSVSNGMAMMVRCMPGPLLAISLPLYLLAQFWLGFRSRSLPLRLRALAKAAAGLPNLWGQRRNIQARRRLSLWQTTRLLTWNPMALSRRRIVPLTAHCLRERARTPRPPMRERRVPSHGNPPLSGGH